MRFTIYLIIVRFQSTLPSAASWKHYKRNTRVFILISLAIILHRHIKFYIFYFTFEKHLENLLQYNVNFINKNVCNCNL